MDIIALRHWKTCSQLGIDAATNFHSKKHGTKMETSDKEWARYRNKSSVQNEVKSSIQIRSRIQTVLVLPPVNKCMTILSSVPSSVSHQSCLLCWLFLYQQAVPFVFKFFQLPFGWTRSTIYLLYFGPCLLIFFVLLTNVEVFQYRAAISRS